MSFGDSQRLLCDATSAYLIGIIQSSVRNCRLSSDSTPELKNSGCLGSWNYEIETQTWTLSPSIGDVRVDKSQNFLPDMRSLVHPDDVASFDEALSRAKCVAGCLQIEHRLAGDADSARVVTSYLFGMGCQSSVQHVAGVLFLKEGAHGAGREPRVFSEKAAIQDDADRAEHQFIKDLAKSLPESIYVSDIEERVYSYKNRDFLGQLGYSPIARGNGLLTVREIVHSNDLDLYDEHQRRIRRDLNNETIETTCRMRTALGEWRWFHLRNVVFRRSESGKPLETIGTIQDVTQQMSHEMHLRETVRQLRAAEIDLKERQEQLEVLNHQLASLATTDGLTGLYNYRAFHEKLAEEVRRARRYDYSVSVVLADVDDFKIFNDRFGHPAGDERLRLFADMLKRDSRDSDFVSRTGGEEFAIILINTGAGDAGRFAQRLVHRLNEDKGGKRLTASFGCAQLEPEDRTKDDFVRRADECLYQAKRQGKNQVVVASKDKTTAQIR